MSASDKATRLPLDRVPTLRVVAMPGDTTMHGAIFGGWLMGQADLAGAATAMAHAQGAAVTVAVEDFSFEKPVCVGDLVSFYTNLESVGNTSMRVKVEVFAERHPSQHQVEKVTEAVLTYVAVDAVGKPRRVAPLAV